MKARKKPVVIEYFEWDGDLMNRDGQYYVPDWAVEALNNGVIFFEGQGELYIKTLEGDHLANVGDFIIQGVKGELYPCRADIFAMTYEPVETSPAASSDACDCGHERERHFMENSTISPTSIDVCDCCDHRQYKPAGEVADHAGDEVKEKL